MLTFTDAQRTNLAQWADILTTTDLPQCADYLHSTEGYCCLGVALELLFHVTWETRCSATYRTPGGDYIKLSRADANQLGLAQAGYTSPRHGEVTLHGLAQQLNDTLRWTFPQIATEIRYWLAHGEVCPETVTALNTVPHL